MISRARARLRYRSRAVKVGWECRFRDAVALSCRMNATLFDPRIPGGAANGKVTSYSLSCSDGKVIGKVQIECAIGFGEGIAEITGTPEYVTAGYVQNGYQIYDNAMLAHGSGDTTFSLPVFQGFDDGLIFPLRWEDISDGGILSNDLASQAAAITGSFAAAVQLQFLNESGGSVGVTQGGTANPTTTTTGVPPDVARLFVELPIGAAVAVYTSLRVMAANPISGSCLLKPCAGNGPFGGSYAINVSPLVVKQGINLEAPSSP